MLVRPFACVNFFHMGFVTQLAQQQKTQFLINKLNVNIFSIVAIETTVALTKLFKILVVRTKVCFASIVLMLLLLIIMVFLQRVWRSNWLTFRMNLRTRRDFWKRKLYNELISRTSYSRFGRNCCSRNDFFRRLVVCHWCKSLWTAPLLMQKDLKVRN